jgi:hypothetical protein
MATGIAQMCWVLRAVREHMSPQPVTATVDRRRWESGDGGAATLLLLEALVTGADKGQGHPGDAKAAVEAFQRAPIAAEARHDPAVPAVNLLAAAAMWAGLVIGTEELHIGGPLYTPQPSLEQARAPARHLTGDG